MATFLNMRATNMKKLGAILYLMRFAAIIAFVLGVFVAQTAYAALPVTLSPAIIDEDAKARDIIKQSIHIVNNSERVLSLYPSVNNVNPEEGMQEFENAHNAEDRKDSLANWIELSRGVVELQPGEERDLSFIIRVNLNAVPGQYHAVISFGDGSSRSQAEAKPDKASLLVNVKIIEDSKEELQLLQFLTSKFFFSGDDVRFSYILENIGDKDVAPKGQVRIYNRRGEEVATLEANSEGKLITPENKELLASVWNGAEGFGQFKALLNVKYGTSERAALNDTIFFWVVPWKLLAGVLAGGTLAVVLIALYFHGFIARRQGGLHLAGAEALGGAGHALPLPHLPHIPHPHLPHLPELPHFGHGTLGTEDGIVVMHSGKHVQKKKSLARRVLGVFNPKNWIAALVWPAKKTFGILKRIRRGRPKLPQAPTPEELAASQSEKLDLPGGEAPEAMPPVPNELPIREEHHRPFAEVFKAEEFKPIKEGRPLVLNLKEAETPEVYEQPIENYVVDLKSRPSPE